MKPLIESYQINPKADLASMPTEILEKIISFALPTVCAYHWQAYPKHFETRWDPAWINGLPLVSKNIRQIAKPIRDRRYAVVICFEKALEGYRASSNDGGRRCEG
jgi:hypothetical protein